MAAGAAHSFAGHADGPGAHELEGGAVGVERLEGDGRVGGHLEAGGAVRLHVHGAEHALEVPAGLHLIESGGDVSARAVVAEVVGEHAELLDRAARDAGEAGAVVDVGDVDGGGVRAGHAPVGDHGRTLPRGEEDRLEEGAVVGLGQQHDVVEGIYEVDAETAFVAELRGGEEVGAAERPGVGEVRLAARELVVHLQVTDVALHRLAASGEFVHEARFARGEAARGDAEGVLRRTPFAVGRIERDGVLARERGIEEEHASVFGAAVVSAGHHHEAVRVVGNGSRAAEEGGEVGAAAPEGELADAVGVHGHQFAREVMLDVGVFPARVGDASIVEHDRGVIGILLVGELDGLARTAVDAVEDAHREVAVLAREELVRARAEHDHLVAVRQVAGIPPLDVVVAVFGGNERGSWFVVRGLWFVVCGRITNRETRITNHDFVDAEEVVGAAEGGEEDAGGVEVEVEVAHNGSVGRSVEGGKGGCGAKVGDDGDFVREADAPEVHVVVGVESEESEVARKGAFRVRRTVAAAHRAVGVGGPDGVLEVAAHAEDAVGVETRIGEQCRAVALHEGDGLGASIGVRGVEVGDGPVAPGGERLHGGAVAGGVIGRIAREVLHGEAGGGGVETPGLVAQADDVCGLVRAGETCERGAGGRQQGVGSHGGKYTTNIADLPFPTSMTIFA